MSDHEEKTQAYSTWGDKILRHPSLIQALHDGNIKPITVQLGLTEKCQSDCPFCSVAGRPLKNYIEFKQLKKALYDFCTLEAKAVELTGSGNPLLYKDLETGEDINDVIKLCSQLKFKIGVITNSHDLKVIKPELHSKIDWIRISLIMLDEGVKPEQYNFREFPLNKLGFSYIIYDETVNPLARTKKVYSGTTKESIENIAKLVELHPEIKFVRIAGNCLIKGNNQKIKEQYKGIIDTVDKHDKFFIKEIGLNDSPYNSGCFTGGIRPYLASHPDGGNNPTQIYICSSHVLQTRNYDINYSLGSIEYVLEIWERLSKNLKELGYPYEVKGNKGANWCSTCKFCYYHNNNQIYHTAANQMPEEDFI